MHDKSANVIRDERMSERPREKNVNRQMTDRRLNGHWSKMECLQCHGAMWILNITSRIVQNRTENQNKTKTIH